MNNYSNLIIYSMTIVHFFNTIVISPLQCIIPQDALHSLMLLMMGKIVARNMSS
jgi:hypothetical protein